jgi:hypothetical protein
MPAPSVPAAAMKAATTAPSSMPTSSMSAPPSSVPATRPTSVPSPSSMPSDKACSPPAPTPCAAVPCPAIRPAVIPVIAVIRIGIRIRVRIGVGIIVRWRRGLHVRDRGLGDDRRGTRGRDCGRRRVLWRGLLCLSVGDGITHSRLSQHRGDDPIRYALLPQKDDLRSIQIIGGPGTPNVGDDRRIADFGLLEFQDLGHGVRHWLGGGGSAGVLRRGFPCPPNKHAANRQQQRFFKFRVIHNDSCF